MEPFSCTLTAPKNFTLQTFILTSSRQVGATGDAVSCSRTGLGFEPLTFRLMGGQSTSWATVELMTFNQLLMWPPDASVLQKNLHTCSSVIERGSLSWRQGLVLADVMHLMNASGSSSSSSSSSSSRQPANQHELICPWGERKGRGASFILK